MARYFKTAATTWNNANNWSATSAAGLDNAGVPTAAQDVIFELASGNCQIDTNAVCRSLDCTSGTGSYAGTISYDTNARTLSIGDGTAGAGNVALKLVSGMTFTRSGTGNVIAFVSTSGTQQTCDFAGFSTGSKTWSGAGGSWQITGTIFSDTDTNITHTGGTLDINGKSFTCLLFTGNTSSTRTLTLGSGNTITINRTGNTGFNYTTAGGLTVSSNTCTFLLNGAAPIAIANGQDFNGATLSFNGFTSTAVCTFSGTPTFGGLSFTSPASTAGAATISGNVIITSNLTCTGAAANQRFFLQSSVLGTPITITNNGTNTISNTDIQDITGAGSVSWDLSGATGGTGDCLGNSGITFTTAVDRYKVAAGNWSDTASWSTMSGGSAGATAPLPQDTCYMDANTPAGSHTIDLPRSGANLIGSNRTLALGAGTIWYGNVTLSGTFAFSGNAAWTFRGRGAQTLTSGGITYPHAITIACVTGTYTLQDAFNDSRSSANALTVTSGTFDTNSSGNYTVTVSGAGGAANLNGSQSTLNMNASTFSFGASGVTTFWNNTGTTINAGSSTITLTAATANTRTFVGNGQKHNILTYTTAGSTGTLVISGSNTFARINFSDASNARTLQLTSGTTTTLAIPNIFGTSGKLMTLNASTGGSAATVKSTSAGYIGTNSTLVSGNTGLSLTADAYRDYISAQDINWSSVPSVLREVTDAKNTLGPRAIQANNRAGTY